LKKILWLGCLSYLVIGIAHIIGGSILEQIVTHYEITYAQGGQWIMNQFFGYLVGVLLGPLLSARLGKRITVVIAFGSLTFAEAVYSMLPAWELMLVVAPLAGFGFGMIESVIGSLIIDLYKNQTASAMSRLETFFGLGALFIPLTAALLIRFHIWEWSFPILTAISGLTLLLWLSLSFGKEVDTVISQPSKQEGETGKPASAKYKARAIPFLVLGMIFFFLYVGVEMSVSHYLPSIMIERSGLSESSAASMLSLFWAFMVVGRLACGFLADRHGYIKYLIVSMVVAVLAFIGMVLLDHQYAQFAMIALSGLGFSGVFGIALVYVNACIKGMTDRTTSLLVACGGIGGALLPKLTGWLMDHYDAVLTVNYVAILVAVMLLFMVLMIFVGRNRNLQE